ncbi:MAG: porphobilinogen deaminase [Bathelium mastoideum]|nr:MAG: porphobilinogen deaminase [Bathelium mastoideum]
MAAAPESASAADSSSTSHTITIGTRSSWLALVQTDSIEKALKQAWPNQQFAVHSMKTLGDRDKVTPLPDFNAKSLWTRDLEVLLLDGTLDMIVHSLKDMPTQLPATLTLGAVPARLDPRDALVVSPRLLPMHTSLASLPAGSLVGTSSVRRAAQLRRRYPHLRVDTLRGNIDTRLAKLDAEGSAFAAAILAAAGLERIGRGDRITAYLGGPDEVEGGGGGGKGKGTGGKWLHAVGQGALGVEVREGDERVARLLERVVCERTMRACLAERSLMRTLEGGCSVPIGVETEWVKRRKGTGVTALVQEGAGVGAKPAREYGADGKAVEGQEGEGDVEETDELVMRATVVSVDGEESVEAEMTRKVTSREEADQFGWDIAGVLVERGAGKILEKINLNRQIIEQQGEA